MSEKRANFMEMIDETDFGLRSDRGFDAPVIFSMCHSFGL